MFEVESNVQKLQTSAAGTPLGVLSFFLRTCLPFRYGMPAPTFP